MGLHRFVLLAFAATALPSLVSARAVNISNTWMLPEEGFPVFYRYFRDRISWYEADAVCQFHHANLVTADSTSQYDAIRAYLKELDITENVWIGLSKTAERPNFTWTDFRPLSGDGYWQQSIPKGSDPLCVAMDPAADFLWKPLACGGPGVASFICELPVPSWAMGPRGCLLTELPSLTVLYIPEQLALELTSDCGLDGTKRIACKGNADREDILKQLTCAIPPEDFDDKSTRAPSQSNAASSSTSDPDNSLNSKTTKPWIWTSNTIDIDYGMPTRHRRETEDTLSPSSTRSTTQLAHKRNKPTTMTTASNSNFDTEVTSISPESDVTLVSSVSAKSDKSTELRATQVADLSTQDANTPPEELGEGLASSAEPRNGDAPPEDAAEYPSAISQGQLFSIIDNGTMFDIIELNDTTPDDGKHHEDAAASPRAKLQTSTDHHENLYTTVVYHKEPPSDTNFVTNKSVKKSDKVTSKKPVYKKESDPKKWSQSMADKNKTSDDKSFSKEIEMYPILTDPSAKLNRTFRKELPVVEDEDPLNDGNGFGIPRVLNFTTNNDIGDHQHVEVKLHDSGNSTFTSLFITTRRSESAKMAVNKKAIHQSIDPKLHLLNNNATENNESEAFSPGKVEEIDDESAAVQKEFLVKSLGGEELDVATTSSDDPLEPEPEMQPRPNRQRQLTRPQRRSFYPYFFSRVLG